jgi:hypothetical protein
METTDVSSLEEEHRKLLIDSDSASPEKIKDRAVSLLQKCREQGQRLSNVEQRDSLRSITNYWGAYLRSHFNLYLDTSLYSFEGDLEVQVPRTVELEREHQNLLAEVDRSQEPTTIQKLLKFYKKCIGQKQEAVSEGDRQYLANLIDFWAKKIDLLLENYEDREATFADFWEEVQKISLELEFADREAELRVLTRPVGHPGASRYVQVYAPNGLGKTYLLKKAKTEYEAIGWLCAWLDFSSHEKPRHLTPLVLRQLGEQFGAKAKGVRTCAGLAQQVMQARRQSVIFLDAVDLATGEVRQWIKTDLIPNLEERIPDPKLRPYFIAASRYPIGEWAVYSRQRFEFIRLTPFNDTVVDDLLRRVAEKADYQLSDDFFQKTTEAILFITKGHPTCIKRVLQEIQEHNFAISSYELAQASTFNQTVGALLDEEILVHVPERSRKVFKTLCVLRGYTPNLLDRLAREGWVPARKHVDWSLEIDLLKTHLVETPDSSPLYRLEPLIRQLVALQMEYNEKDKFLELNRTALEIFEEQVRGKDKEGNEPPNRPCDRMQVALAVEALYHQAILLRQDNADSERARSELLGKVREYLSYRLTLESDNYWVNLLLGTLEKDAELTALVYELTDEGGLEFVLQPLYDLSKVQEG